MNKLAARSKGVLSPIDVKRSHHHHHHQQHSQPHSRDNIKKASYYVWFLGAKECRGLSGDEYVHPAVRQLIEKENNVEPLKVTLQVSSKGLKIIHNNSNHHASSKTSGNKSSKDDQPLKHFVPDNNICYVTQEAAPNDDIVACIVLITVTKYPLHVHVYRCDSVDTATVLRQHLQSLIERPENQKTLTDIEQQQPLRRQQPPPMVKRPNLVSDKLSLTPPSPHTRSSLRESPTEEHNSESSGGGNGGNNGSSSSGGAGEGELFTLDERMAGLYLSLTSELREKLDNRKNNGPLLFPPKDYDMTLRRLRDAAKLRPTVLASSGAISSVNGGRRSTERADSSGKSSGIGSDEAPSSPTHERGSSALPSSSPTTVLPSSSRNSRKLHNDSSSDDEHWNSEEEPITKPIYAQQRDAKRSPNSSQPIIVNIDPANESLHHIKNSIWPPISHSSSRAGGRPTISSSRGHGDRYDDSRLLRNETPGMRYHELPEEKRYPGLDRDTAARLPFNPGTERPGQVIKKSTTPTSPIREYDWDRQLRNYAPSERIHADEQSYHQHPSMKRSIKSPGIKSNGCDDERKYYRYS